MVFVYLWTNYWVMWQIKSKRIMLLSLNFEESLLVGKFSNLIPYTFFLVLVLFAAMDVSSDLTELGKTPVAVVCAGAKSILDIPRTLEYLIL